MSGWRDQDSARSQQPPGIGKKPPFRDRRDAGRILAAALQAKTGLASVPVVLALPRGGVPVGFEVAAALNAPLDVCVVRRVEVPDTGGILNLALGNGHVILSESNRTRNSAMSERFLMRVVQREGRVILVDDGLAAPETFIAAVASIRARCAARVTVAVPVAAGSSLRQLLAIVDDLVCLELPNPFHGIGVSYDDYSEVTDLEVRHLHGAARMRVSRDLCD